MRVVVADETVRRRWAELLPGLARRFCHGRFFYRCVPPGKPVHHRSGMHWRMQELEPLVVRDQGAFDSDLHRNAAAAGATLIRLEFPGPTADLTTSSIWRTDLVATTLEHVIGLQYGWLAMNRRTQPVWVTPPKLGPGTEARVWKIRDGQPVATPQIIQPGSQVWLQTATALCIPSH